MLFNSYIFMLFFFPMVLIGWFGLNHFKKTKLANIYLLGMSLWFYGFFNPWYLCLILGSVLFNFSLYKIFDKSKNEPLRKVVLIIGLLCNVGILFYYKYYDFFFSNINILFGTSFAMKHLLLPLGISFFTFQQLSFVVDSYKRQTPKYDLLSYSLFVTYFPQLIAGPIVTHDELVPQFQDLSKRKFNWDNFSKGLFMLALGMSKKVLIADSLSAPVNWGFANVGVMTSWDVLIVVLSYTFQIYFDFSGYSDMAIGMGKMMNYDITMNFNSPYKATTIVEFWSRWHMTLTRFFTRYVYIPLGGSRKGKLRTYLNVMIVFLVSGIWHGANWTFILWGVLHGAFQVITKHFQKIVDKIWKPINWIITFIFLNLTWVLFRANSIADAGTIIGKFFAFDFSSVSRALVRCFRYSQRDIIFGIFDSTDFVWGYAAIFLAVVFAMIFTKNAKERFDVFKPSVKTIIITTVLLVSCVLSFAGVSEFLYWNF